MNPFTCPKCGRPVADVAACPDCGHAATNGVAPPAASVVNKPPPPPELAGMVFCKMTPEEIEWSLRTFNLEEFMAGVREIEETGGLELKDFIHELEEGAPTRE